MFQEIKKLVKHSIVYGVGGILGKTIGFLMIPIYTRFLTTTDYGVLELLVPCQVCFAMFGES